jgi:virulence-associated protein VapD
MPKNRKAINFDLNTKILQSIFKNTRKPYSDIKKELLKLGFERRQYSGYTSVDRLMDKEVTIAIKTLIEKLPWLSTPGLVQRIDVTDIGRQYDLSSLFEETPNLEQSKVQPTPPGQSTLSMKEIAQATEEHGEKSAPGRDTLDIGERV